MAVPDHEALQRIVLARNPALEFRNDCGSGVEAGSSCRSGGFKTNEQFLSSDAVVAGNGASSSEGGEVSPVEINILQIVDRAPSIAVVTVVVSLGLVEVNGGIGEIDDGDKVVPGLPRSIRSGHKGDTLDDSHIFGRYDDKFVWSNGLTQRVDGIGDSARSGHIILNIEVNSVQFVLGEDACH